MRTMSRVTNRSEFCRSLSEAVCSLSVEQRSERFVMMVFCLQGSTWLFSIIFMTNSSFLESSQKNKTIGMWAKGHALPGLWFKG